MVCDHFLVIIFEIVQMAKDRVYSSYTCEAGVLLGKQVRLGRKQRKWTEHELAERGGISRATLQKIEKGDLSVAIGLVFEVAALVGIKLFDSERSTLASHLARTEDKLAVLPSAVRKSRKTVDDDF
jgi:transcriptional regulator with XRE-family HTH domain